VLAEACGHAPTSALGKTVPATVGGPGTRTGNTVKYQVTINLRTPYLVPCTSIGCVPRQETSLYQVSLLRMRLSVASGEPLRRPNPQLRGQQDAVWSRQQLGNQSARCSRSSTPPHWPPSPGCPRAAWLAAMPAVLAAAPSPAVSARVTRTQLRSLLVKAGRKRNIDTDAERLRTVFRANGRWHRRGKVVEAGHDDAPWPCSKTACVAVHQIAAWSSSERSPRG
jgi:hypothetical protein